MAGKAEDALPSVADHVGEMTSDSHAHPHERAPNGSLPREVSYFGASASRLFATESAIVTLNRTRLWATLAAIICVGGGGLGVLLGLYIGILLIFNPAARGEANIIICGGATFYGMMAVVAGVLLVRFVLSVRRTCRMRQPDDLERTMVALWWLMLWIALCLAAVAVYPVVVMAVAAWLNVWP